MKIAICKKVLPMQIKYGDEWFTIYDLINVCIRYDIDQTEFMECSNGFTQMIFDTCVYNHVADIKHEQYSKTFMKIIDILVDNDIDLDDLIDYVNYTNVF